MRDPSLWPNVEEPATQHPFSPTLAQMVGIYKHLERTTDRRQPLIKLAAYVQKSPRVPNLWLFLFFYVSYQVPISQGSWCCRHTWVPLSDRDARDIHRAVHHEVYGWL
jgi:hypothetical protein